MSPWEKEMLCPLQPLRHSLLLPAVLSITDRGETLCFLPLIANLLGPLGCGVGR